MQSFLEKTKNIIANNQDVIAVFEELDRTGRFKKRAYKSRISFTLDAELFNRFRAYCKNNGLNMSGKIEAYMRKELNSK